METDVKRQPTGDTGVYLFQHTHQWEEAGSERWPSGNWHPVFRCAICTDIICDLHVTDRTA